MAKLWNQRRRNRWMGLRPPEAYQIWLGGTTVRKVRRWLTVMSGGHQEQLVTKEARQRHVHPRSKRGVVR